MALDRVAVPTVDLLRVARETGLTTDDAAYLWLVHTRDAEVVTLDRELDRSAGAREP